MKKSQNKENFASSMHQINIIKVKINYIIQIEESYQRNCQELLVKPLFIESYKKKNYVSNVTEMLGSTHTFKIIT